MSDELSQTSPGSAVVAQEPDTVPAFWPLWVAFVLDGLVLGVRLLELVFPQSRGFGGAENLAFVADIVYYFMIMYRMTRVLEVQPYWWGSFTPLDMVWRQFIPLYNIYVLYTWTRQVGEYTDWRLHRVSKIGLMSFLVMFVGGVCSWLSDNVLSAVGGVVATFAFVILYGPLQAVLAHPLREGDAVPEFPVR